jgi:hypothetical protein
VLYGNSFSAKHPFRYKFGGQESIEFQCPDSIKKLIGQSAPIIYTHQNAIQDPKNPNLLLPKSETLVIGTYKITGYDEENACEIGEYEFNDEMVKQNGLQWILEDIENGIYPDTSAAYLNKLKYDRTKNRLIQTDFKLKHLAIVDRGNCSKPFCTIKKKE